MRKLAVIALLAAACGGSSGSSSGACASGNATPVAPGGAITLQNLAFSPSCAKTTAGATLTFRNNEAMNHTVTQASGPGSAGDYGPQLSTVGDTLSHTFAQAGTYSIICTLHQAQGMRMTLVVE